MALQKGMGAIDSLTQENGGGGGKSAEFTKLESGETIKVAVKSINDIASYYGYGYYGKSVNTFQAKVPSDRNSKGFVSGNATPWDKTSQYYYDQAKKSNDNKEEEELKKLGYAYKGKPRFIIGFVNLETGEDIVVDFTKNQALNVYPVIKKYEKKLDKLPFELSKVGSSTSTTFTLSPIIDVDEDLTEDEQKVFAEVSGKEFNDELFDDVLITLDENEQIEKLTQTGFDVSLIGYGGETAQAGGGKTDAEEFGEDASTDEDPDGLPF